jgi:N-acetyl-gamma-glutamyl-phosphate reductase
LICFFLFILGLPDAASEQAATWVEADNDRTVLIDASTAFRLDENWTYGFPGMFRRIGMNVECQNTSIHSTIYLICFVEISKEQREALKKSKRISNPGCYPTGFISLTRPLVNAGILKEGTPVTVNAVSGYSGGGKPLMELYEGADEIEPWGAYGFSLVRFQFLISTLLVDTALSLVRETHHSLFSLSCHAHVKLSN